MINTFIRTGLVFVLCIGMFKVYADTPEDKYYHRNVRTVLQKHCASCHNEVDKKAGINLADFYFAVSVIRRGELFQKVIEEVESGNMPPAGKPSLTPVEMDSMLVGLRTMLGKALAEPDPGEAVMRRLSHREYTYTIQDLVGVTFNARDYFPSEGSGGEGFDNQSRVLFITPLMMERYYEAADSILRQAKQAPEVWQKIIPQTYKPGLGFRWGVWWKETLMGGEASFRKPLGIAEKIILPFATRAYRRFLTSEEEDQLLGFFKEIYRDEWRNQDGFEKAVATTLKVVMVSPNFLYRHEANLPFDKPYKLSNFELASRLSYLLWSSMPDEQLFQTAYREDLHDPKVLNRETLRMMSDPRFMRFAEAFAGQWLGVEEMVNEPKTDLEKFPELTPALRKAMHKEVVQYFYHVFTQSNNLLELIDSDYTFLNEDLAKHYGISGVQGQAMRAVQLPDRNRGGVLGMGAVLTSTSLPLRTSPVIRGKWVLEQLLGTPPPPPPPDVPELEAAKENVKDELDLRALLAQHRSPSACTSCHQKMDPIGLGLENFDAIGRWRENYAEAVAVDASGVLTTGQRFQGPAELKNILCEEQTKFAKTLSRKLLSYALGRGVGFKDTPALESLKNSLLDNEFNSQQFMLALVNSFHFRHKRSDMKDRYKGI